MPSKSSGADNAPTPSPVIVRGFESPSKQKWVEVIYKGESALIEYAQFAERAGIWAQLSAKGCVFVRKADKTSLIDQVEELEDFKPRLIFERPGWLGRQYANASGRVFAPQGVQPGAVGFVPSSAKCASAGTPKNWKVKVAALLTGHHIPCFMVMTAFAAPMLELVGRTENFGFELAGEGGKGKSTVQRLMASTTGAAMAKDRGYITTFHMTPAALERSMRAHADAPFIIDEANLFGTGESGSGNRRLMRECQKFRVWAGIMGKKETQYVATQRTNDTQ